MDPGTENMKSHKWKPIEGILDGWKTKITEIKKLNH